MSLGVCFFKKLNLVKVGAFAWCSVKIHVFSVSGLKKEKLIKKQTYTKTETCKLYSRVFWTFLPNDVKINPHNFELYRFKIKTFFETQCRSHPEMVGDMSLVTYQKFLLCLSSHGQDLYSHQKLNMYIYWFSSESGYRRRRRRRTPQYNHYRAIYRQWLEWGWVRLKLRP